MWPDGCEFHHEARIDAGDGEILNALRDGAPAGAQYVITLLPDGRKIVGYNAIGIPKGLAKAKIVSALRKLDSQGGKKYKASRDLSNHQGTGTWHRPDIPRLKEGEFDDG